jgi:amidohydrolase
LGTVRALNQKNREFIAKRIEEIAAKVAEGMRGSIEFKYGWEGPPPLVNNDEITAAIEAVAKEVLGEDKVKQIQRPSMGGEDFAFFLEEVPGTFIFLPGCNRDKGQVYPHHNSKFDIDEDVLWIGPAIFSAMAFEWLKNNS